MRIDEVGRYLSMTKKKKKIIFIYIWGQSTTGGASINEEVVMDK